MRQSLIVLSAVLIAVSLAQDVSPSPQADYVDGEQSQLLISPELQLVAAQMFGTNSNPLLHAVQLQMSKYDLDMKKPEGRRNWHGRLVREEIDTNELYKVSVYSNEITGAVWRYREGWNPHRGVNTIANRMPSYGTNGIPWRLKAARARRAAEQGTTNVVNVVVGGER